MRLAPWYREEDMNVDCFEKENNACAILRCEDCNKIIFEGFLLHPETDKEACKLEEFLTSVRSSRSGLCLHPDNVLVCRECFKNHLLFYLPANP